MPRGLAAKVKRIAKTKRVSANHVLVSLVEEGLEAREAEKRRFFALAENLVNAKTQEEQQRIKRALAKSVFGQ